MWKMYLWIESRCIEHRKKTARLREQSLKWESLANPEVDDNTDDTLTGLV